MIDHIVNSLCGNSSAQHIVKLAKKRKENLCESRAITRTVFEDVQLVLIFFHLSSQIVEMKQKETVNITGIQMKSAASRN